MPSVYHFHIVNSFWPLRLPSWSSTYTVVKWKDVVNSMKPWSKPLIIWEAQDEDDSDDDDDPLNGKLQSSSMTC